MGIIVNSQSKEERTAERAEWRKQQLEDRDYEKSMNVEYQRREDFISERDFWGGIVGIFLEQGKSVNDAIRLTDQVFQEYKQRFQ